MIVQQELYERGDEIKLRNTFNTDDIEEFNWQQRQHTNKGFMYDKGKLAGREIANIPVDEAAMLEAVYDLDYLAFSRNNDVAALRRLLKRFPHWVCSDGGF